MEKKVEFMSQGYELSGVLHLPEIRRPPVVVGVHGLFANKDSPKQKALACACTAMGMAYLRFDHRGCGQSQGDFPRVNTFAGRVADMAAAVEYVEKREDLGPGLGFFGSSMGGAVCLHLASRRPVDALVLYAAPLYFEPLAAALRIPCEKGKSAADFFKDDMQGSPLPCGQVFLGPTLIFHGDEDKVVPLSHAMEIHQRAAGPKRLIVLAHGDHAMSRPSHQKLFIKKASQWLARHLVQT